jgi:hypothetical protein
VALAPMVVIPLAGLPQLVVLSRAKRYDALVVSTALPHNIASAIVRANATLCSNSRSCAKSGN